MPFFSLQVLVYMSLHEDIGGAVKIRKCNVEYDEMSSAAAARSAGKLNGPAYNFIFGKNFDEIKIRGEEFKRLILNK